MRTSIRSLLAVGSGATLMFVCAYALDNIAQMSSPIARALGANNHSLGMIVSAMAGFLVARTAPCRPIAHAFGLVGLFLSLCAAQWLSTVAKEPWWGILLGDLLPVICCATAIYFGALLARLCAYRCLPGPCESV